MLCNMTTYGTESFLRLPTTSAPFAELRAKTDTSRHLKPLNQNSQSTFLESLKQIVLVSNDAASLHNRSTRDFKETALTSDTRHLCLRYLGVSGTMMDRSG